MVLKNLVSQFKIQQNKPSTPGETGKPFVDRRPYQAQIEKSHHANNRPSSRAGVTAP